VVVLKAVEPSFEGGVRVLKVSGDLLTSGGVLTAKAGVGGLEDFDKELVAVGSLIGTGVEIFQEVIGGF
jgi:hypothetical protein